MTKPATQNADLTARPATAGLAPSHSAKTPEIDNRPPEAINPAHRESVMLGLEQSRRGDYASEAEVLASFALFDP